MRRLVERVVAGLTVVLFPAVCFAQFGAIAGVVTDGSGSVVPGVTVEAASPVLIEKVRTAVTDGAGRYNLEQLRPGVYDVTFSLTGFSTVRRERVEVSVGFTAPINGSLRVSTVQETITVTGQAPVVDVQGVTRQRTLPKEALDALPTARSFATLGTTLPAVTANQRDVGGTQGERGNILSSHGGNAFDMTIQVDGVPMGGIGISGGGAWSTFSLNDIAAQEISFETNAISIETSSGGVRVNVIPREGGNRFSGQLFGNFAVDEMSRSNFTDKLQARGAAAPAGFVKLWDESAALGGPMRRDRVWFFAAHRYRGNDLRGTSFFSTDPTAVVPNPDISRPLHSGGWDLDNQVRVTAQVTPRNKVSGFFDRVNKCNCPAVVATLPSTGESVTSLTYPKVFATSVGWQSPISSRLLWDSNFSYNRANNIWVPLSEGVTATSPLAVLDLASFSLLRAPFPGNFFGFPGDVFSSGDNQGQKFARGSLSYVTGSHSVKVGFSLHTGDRAEAVNQYSNSTLLVSLPGNPVVAGAPFRQVILSTAPYTKVTDLKADTGIYASDKWTMRRLTVTGGIRFDHFNTSIPAQSAPASTWVGARSFEALPDVPNWKDISPRVGVVYDLFGNGKTAVKASVSRYVAAQVFAFSNPVNPLVASRNTMTVGWVDFNRDFVPQGNPLSTDPLVAGEFVGPVDPNFRKAVITTRYDPEVSQGWGKRPYNWEYAVSMQHELMPRVSLDVGYYRRTFGNQVVTDNLDVTPANFDPFCITAPTDARLGSVSGTQVCGLYDVTPAKAGIASNQVIRFAKDYSGQTSQIYNGFDATVNARPTGRLFLQAGVSAGRTVTANCAIVDNPMTLRFCEVRQPWLGNYRASGGYTFPWQVQVSAVFQSLPPDPTASIVNFPVTNATPGLSLGRPIATPGGSITATLIDPSEYASVGFADRVNQLDLRLTKGVPLGRARVDIMVDLYNAFNVAPIQTYTPAYGVNWTRPVLYLQSSYVKLGGRLTF